MARKRISLALVAIAVGLMFIGAAFVYVHGDEPGPRLLSGYVYKAGEYAPQGTFAHCILPDDPHPQTQLCVQGHYFFSAFKDGTYQVWATYEDEYEICESEHEFVEFKEGDGSKDQNLVLWCMAKP